MFSSKDTHVSALVPIAPNIVPLKKQVHMWIVKVPLKPFTIPYKKLPDKIDIPPSKIYTQLTPVRNQGDCGSCFAFAVCDMLSDRAVKMTNGVFNKNISVQQILSCYDRQGCENGGSPEDVVVWLTETKTYLNTENKAPYQQISGGYTNTKCKVFDEAIRVGVVKDSVYSLAVFIPEKGYDEEILKQNVKNMKRELVLNGPFFCAMTVYDDLYTYNGKEPYIPGRSSELIGGHAIEIVGYTSEPVKGASDGYWVCRNSWGDNWPINSSKVGFFHIPIGKNICGIESRCGSALPLILKK
jgi:cathepsin C